jgi:hypothetical protein
MHKQFYIPREYDIVAIKREGFIDMSKKLKSLRHEFKNSHKIQPDDTPATVTTKNLFFPH